MKLNVPVASQIAAVLLIVSTSTVHAAQVAVEASPGLGTLLMRWLFGG